MFLLTKWHANRIFFFAKMCLEKHIVSYFVMCLGSPFHRPNLRKEAELKYAALLEGYKSLEKIQDRLLDENDDHSALLRGILLGKNEAASVKELLFGRLLLDLLLAKHYDKQESNALIEKYFKGKELQCIYQSTEALVRSFPTEIQAAFFKGKDRISKSVVRAMFKLSNKWGGKLKSEKDLLGTCFSLPFRQRVVGYCYEIAMKLSVTNGRGRPEVTEAIANEAFQKATKVRFSFNVSDGTIC